ncbi:MAG: hypothetical protein IKL53_01570, partial [Lachnospiraceae bacterium]|nr:hypothetical protein [Lachnospiraceae bacterium]
MAKRMYNKEKRMARNLEKTKVEKERPFDLFAEFKKLYDKERSSHHRDHSQGTDVPSVTFYRKDRWIRHDLSLKQ